MAYRAGDLYGPGIIIPQAPGQNKVGEVSVAQMKKKRAHLLIADLKCAAGCVVSVSPVSLIETIRKDKQ